MRISPVAARLLAISGLGTPHPQLKFTPARPRLYSTIEVDELTGAGGAEEAGPGYKRPGESLAAFVVVNGVRLRAVEATAIRCRAATTLLWRRSTAFIGFTRIRGYLELDIDRWKAGAGHGLADHYGAGFAGDEVGNELDDHETGA